MLTSSKQKFAVADFERMQQDVLSIPARRFQGVLRGWTPPSERARSVVDRLVKWDARLTADSAEALIFEVWFAKLPAAVFGERDGSRVVTTALLETLEKEPPSAALGSTLDATLVELDRTYGSDMSQWRWGRLHQIRFRHPSSDRALDRGRIARPGDGNTVNSTSGSRFQQTNGASYRMVLDFADWDRSVMTNVPGESGDPASPFYSNLVEDWAQGRYHPMPFSRKAVEAAAAERIQLLPAK
jgi:penicillin amidase